MYSHIKNLIFDLGGVIINVDVSLTEAALAAITPAYRRAELGQNPTIPQFFYDVETGRLSDTAFRDALRQHYHLTASDTEIDAAWNALLQDFPEARIARLREWASRYRIFLLSNTNNIHASRLEADFESQYGFPLRDLFEYVHYSHQMGLRKPMREIYETVLAQHQLEAKQTAFFDDNAANVAIAQSVGIQAELIIPQQYTLLDLAL